MSLFLFLSYPLLALSTFQRSAKGVFFKPKIICADLVGWNNLTVRTPPTHHWSPALFFQSLSSPCLTLNSSPTSSQNDFTLRFALTEIFQVIPQAIFHRPSHLINLHTFLYLLSSHWQKTRVARKTFTLISSPALTDCSMCRHNQVCGHTQQTLPA